MFHVHLHPYYIICSYEGEFMQRQKITEAKTFNPTFMYIDDVLLNNNPNFANEILPIYPQRTSDKGNDRNSFLCLISWHLPQTGHQWSTFYYNNRNDFSFAIVNFPHLDSNTQTTPCIDLIFHNSYATLELAVCTHAFHNLTVFRVLNYLIKDF